MKKKKKRNQNESEKAEANDSGTTLSRTELQIAHHPTYSRVSNTSKTSIRVILKEREMLIKDQAHLIKFTLQLTEMTYLSV